jgi:CcmD family protein
MILFQLRPPQYFHPFRDIFVTFNRFFCNMKKAISLIMTLIFLSLNAANAQSTGEVDFMRNTGMMYVVVGVILIIFIGIIVYLINIDRKLTKLENQINQNE